MPKKITLQLDTPTQKLLDVLCVASGDVDAEGVVTRKPAREVVTDALLFLYRNLMERAKELAGAQGDAARHVGQGTPLIVDSSGVAVSSQGGAR